jgi:energy-coupling factor transport system permease protein
MGVIVLAVRIVFEVLFGPPIPGTVAFTLPSVALPDAMAGVRLGGPVTYEGLLLALYSGLQLVVIFACIGAANALANPTRLLKSVPGALYEVGVAVVVAVTLVPTAITQARRVREARRLRGRSAKGIRALASICITVLEEALERSLELAAAMDSRGYGRMRQTTRGYQRTTGALMIGGLVAVLIGSYALLDAQTEAWLAFATLGTGLLVAFVGLHRSNQRAIRTVYRADPWRWPEWATVAAGVFPCFVLIVLGAIDPESLFPTTLPLTWPTFSLLGTLAILVAAAPAWLTPTAPQVVASRVSQEPADVTAVRQEVAA